MAEWSDEIRIIVHVTVLEYDTT